MIKLLKFGKQKCVKAGSFSSIVQCVDRAQSSVIIDKRNATRLVCGLSDYLKLSVL